MRGKMGRGGRWGDGEMGRWGDGEMGRWGEGEDGETGRWGRWGDGGRENLEKSLRNTCSCKELPL